MTDTEFQDAICEPGHLREIVSDDDSPYLVLFASVIGDEDAVEARRLEWEELFS